MDAWTIGKVVHVSPRMYEYIQYILPNFSFRICEEVPFHGDCERERVRAESEGRDTPPQSRSWICTLMAFRVGSAVTLKASIAWLSENR